MPTNRSMYSVHEPVVEKVNYTFDLASSETGLAYGEQDRLAGWFEAIGIGYGDRVSIEDPLQSAATRSAVEAVAARYRVILDDATSVAAGPVPAGTTRIVVARSKAVVHGCPDWSAHADANFVNGLSKNYGCAVNSNLAAMVANPEHLIKGEDGQGDTAIMSSNKAISTYRQKPATGAGALKESGSREN